MICVDHGFSGDGGRCTDCERLLRFHPHPFEQAAAGELGRCICGGLKKGVMHR